MTDTSPPRSVPPRFHDGIQSSPHWVEVVTGEEGITLYKESDIFARYPYSEIFVRSDWSDCNGAIFGFNDHPDAGLSINQKDLFCRIQSRLHAQKRASYRIPLHTPHLIAIAILSGAALYFSLPLLSVLSGSVAHMVPLSAEKRLGDWALTAMEKDFPVCTDKEAVASLQKISNRLSLASGDTALVPDIHLYKTSLVNAFTLPGQKMAVLGGFLQNATSENEIAGVLAHEMGHMAKRDALEAFVESQGISVLAAMIGGSGAYGDAAKTAALFQSLSYSRKKEFAADAFGADLLTRAHYTTAGLSDFLEKSKSINNNGINKVLEHVDILSTHPNTDERIRRIKAMPSLRDYTPQLTQAEFLHLKSACAPAPRTTSLKR